jgi:hypothetical protein
MKVNGQNSGQWPAVALELDSNGGYDINPTKVKVLVVDRAVVSPEFRKASGVLFADGEWCWDFDDVTIEG